ncbi:MAG: CvpA family protein, partial [Synergistaceae bacterium]|nr:CvpA family protein [Synergistaceae bacterium]
MSVTDIILLAIGMFFVVRGLFRGLTGEIFSLLGTAGAFFCAMKFNGTISGILQERLGLSPAIATIITMLGIFFVVFFGCSFLEWTFKKVIEKTKLTATDKFLGAGVGAVKFYVVALFALLMSA